VRFSPCVLSQAKKSDRVSRVHRTNSFGHQSRLELNIRPRDCGGGGVGQEAIKTDGVTFSNPRSRRVLTRLIENLPAVTIARSFRLYRSDII